MTLRLLRLLALLVVAAPAVAGEVALVTSVQGRVMRLGDAPAAVEGLARLRDGERLALERDSRLRLVYVDSGRQETWTGPGRLELAARESRPEGLAAAELKQLPLPVARQMGRTPDSAGGRPPTRTRAVPTPDALARLEESYRAQLAARADPDDLAPEIFMLSGLFEMRELERVERLIGELQREHPKQPEAGLLVALYKKALRNAREGRK